jgi:uncharacterized protein (DUF3820 family)
MLAVLNRHQDTHEGRRIVARPFHVSIELARQGFQDGAGGALLRGLLFLQAEGIVRELEEQGPVPDAEQELQLPMTLRVGMRECVDDDLVDQERNGGRLRGFDVHVLDFEFQRDPHVRERRGQFLA